MNEDIKNKTDQLALDESALAYVLSNGFTPDQYKDIEPCGAEHVHTQLQTAFLAFILNDEYKPEVNKKKCLVNYIKPGKKNLIIDQYGVMNYAAQQRYNIMLKLYLRKGHSFIHGLKQQITIVAKAA